eukprot:TRINITY_DN10185_c0_g1_i1.p1 TRINITY_DN10185_c0_g1~~TRINITY_DN10185_c0_g1_i1.p1  ORF type:complete len:299 (+),score=53.11 TRINITY_DN10185_c0_g1_i1:40-936(+)
MEQTNVDSKLRPLKKSFKQSTKIKKNVPTRKVNNHSFCEYQKYLCDITNSIQRSSQNNNHKQIDQESDNEDCIDNEYGNESLTVDDITIIFEDELNITEEEEITTVIRRSLPKLNAIENSESFQMNVSVEGTFKPLLTKKIWEGQNTTYFLKNLAKQNSHDLDRVCQKEFEEVCSIFNIVEDGSIDGEKTDIDLFQIVLESNLVMIRLQEEKLLMLKYAIIQKFIKIKKEKIMDDLFSDWVLNHTEQEMICQVDATFTQRLAKIQSFDLYPRENASCGRKRKISETAFTDDRKPKHNS